ncbi:MAG: phosphoribosylanthranilate isomerase [Anaerolineales bacterium]|nr:phosphoribosylanthranilate isomerase [Anaerolineales bacterium]
MLVQIYAIKTIEEAQMCINAGADRFGVVVGEQGKTPDETNHAQTRKIFEATPPPYPKMALTVETEVEAIEAMVRGTGAEILHLSGDINKLPPEGVLKLRKHLPGVQIVQAIPVSGPEAIELALAYEEVSDVCFLDSKDPNMEVIGATGAVHDWSISREIVKKLSIPVILAGGLSAENVAEAIRAVQPWGVDSNSFTNIPGTWNKDPERVRSFVAEAKGAR